MREKTKEMLEQTAVSLIALIYLLRCVIAFNNFRISIVNKDPEMWTTLDRLFCLSMSPLLGCLLGHLVSEITDFYENNAWIKTWKENQRSRRVQHIKKLEDMFENLTVAEKEILNRKGLTDKSGNHYQLKFICPISQLLMVDPIEALVENNANSIQLFKKSKTDYDLYDKSSFWEWYRLAHPQAKKFSPRTNRKFARSDGNIITDKPQNKVQAEYEKYIENLSEAIAEIQANRFSFRDVARVGIF